MQSTRDLERSAHAAEIACRAMNSLLVYFEKTQGRKKLQESIDETVGQFNVDLAYLQNEHNWISFAIGQRILDALTRAAGNENFPREAGRITASREVLGIVYPLLRACGSPRLCYKVLVESSEQYNRVGTYRAIELTRNRLLLAYKSEVREPNLGFSEYRMGQFESFPTIWGLPPARARKISCQVQGADESVYELQWLNPASHVKTLLTGLISGLLFIGAATVIGRNDLLLPMFLGGAVAGSLLQRLYDQRQRIADRDAMLEEQGRGLLETMAELQIRFLEVEGLNSKLGVANEKLQRMDQIKRDFLANVSHELRTPLTLSIGPIESLLTLAPDKNWSTQLSIVLKNQRRLLGLINDLLDFSKMDAGEVSTRFSCVDLVDHLGSLLDSVRAATEARGISFGIDVPGEPVYVYVDRDKFDKVVMNLLSNAFKFTGDGGRIDVELTANSTRALLKVSDSGIGIPGDKLDSIFDRFSQVDASATRKYAGTGIGLAMVQEYVHLHGGEIHVESEVGQGSVFTVDLPLGRSHLDSQDIGAPVAANGERNQLSLDIDDVEDEDDVPAELGESEARTAQTFSTAAASRIQASMSELHARPRVLVVDDTKDMRTYIKSILVDSYEVFTAKDGEMGFERAKALQPDLIVSDVMMPKLSGDELCKKIKSEPGMFSRTPVILVTARADEKTKLVGLDCGADDYLFKPFNAEELRLRVRNMVEKRRQDLALFMAHERMDADLRSAGKFQKTLLPESPKLPWVKFASVFQPMDVAGGDFYDFWLKSEDQIRVFFGDVVGHGVQGALRASVIKQEYEHFKEQLASPAEVLNGLHDRLVEHYPHILSSGLTWGCDLCCDAICADITRSAGGDTLVKMSTSSLVRPVYVRNGQVHEVPMVAMTLGRLAFATYEELEFTLKAGDRLYFYTDGLTEQVNSDDVMFGPKRMQEILEATHGHKPLEEGLDTLLEAWNAFRGETPILDDLTLVALESTHETK